MLGRAGHGCRRPDESAAPIFSSVVTIIGTSLMPVALHWAAGGVGAADYGAPGNLALAALVLGIITVVSRWGRGFLRTIAVLLGLLGGSVVAACVGKMTLAGVVAEPWVQITTPFWFGPPQFHLTAILSMSLVGLVCMIESNGVFMAMGQITGRPITDHDLTRGLRAEGAAIFLGGCLNSFPYTTFSQNAGLVALTGVKSRYVVAMAGAILVALGLLPKFAALVAGIPVAVLGGAGIVMFGMVAAAGIRILGEVDFEREHNMFIVAVSVGLGLGVTVVPQAFAVVPQSVRWLFSEGIVVGSLAAVFLNLIFNGSQGILFVRKKIRVEI